MKPADRQAAFERLRTLNPEPKTELEYQTPFQLLAAVLLSAQATDKSVNLATRKLFAVASTPADILALGEEGLIPYLQTIGLFRSKARHLVQTCRRQHGGEVPHSRPRCSLPGVARRPMSSPYSATDDPGRYSCLPGCQPDRPGTRQAGLPSKRSRPPSPSLASASFRTWRCPIATLPVSTKDPEPA
jgi:hypothetical protein